MNTVAPTSGTSKLSEFKLGWKVLFASFVGVMLGLTALPFYTFGVFLQPLQAEFGWSRGEIQLALLYQTIGALVMMPVVGWASDKYGVRRVALISMFFYGLAFAAISTLTNSLWHYIGSLFVLGALGAGTIPITWTKAVNGAFNTHRGVALGIALMGTGFTGFFAPGFASWIIESYDWRSAYLALAAFPLFIGLPVVYIFFHEKPYLQPGQESDTAVQNLSQAGVSLAAALRDYRFWVIAFAFMIISFGIGGSIPNLFPFFVDAGYAPGVAAEFLSIIGLTVILGRVATGFLLDHFWAPLVAAILMSLPVIACVLLSSGSATVLTAYLATAIIGLAAGAEFDIIAFLASRYFGLKNYSKIYSLLYAAFAIGAAAAPSIFGSFYDSQGNYNQVFLISAGLFALGSVMLLTLGRYPEFAAISNDAENAAG